MPSPRDVTVFGSRRTTNVQSQIQSNERDELHIAQGLPAYTEQTRKGQGWAVMATAAVAALVVRPTTVCALELYNGYSSGGLSLVIDRLFSHELVTSTTGLGGGAGIYACVTASKTAPASASLTVRGNSGKAYGGNVVNAVGTTIVDSGWFPWGSVLKKESAGAVVPGGIMFVNIEGRLIVPPQCSLAIHVVSGYVADTFTSGVAWYEEQLTIL